MSVKPLAIAIVVCELAIVDVKTRNITTVSCFSRRVVEGPLAVMPPFYIVVTLVDGHGKTPAKLVIERLDNLEITYERAVTLTFADTHQELSGIFRIPPHAFPVHGFYHALFIVDGESIAQKRFSILPKESKS